MFGVAWIGNSMYNGVRVVIFMNGEVQVVMPMYDMARVSDYMYGGYG